MDILTAAKRRGGRERGASARGPQVLRVRRLAAERGSRGPRRTLTLRDACSFARRVARARVRDASSTFGSRRSVARAGRRLRLRLAGSVQEVGQGGVLAFDSGGPDQTRVDAVPLQADVRDRAENLAPSFDTALKGTPPAVQRHKNHLKRSSSLLRRDFPQVRDRRHAGLAVARRLHGVRLLLRAVRSDDPVLQRLLALPAERGLADALPGLSRRG